MSKYYRNLSLYHKVMLLTFGITLLIVLVTGGISFSLQTKEMRESLTNHVTGLSTLLASSIDGDELKKVIAIKDENMPYYQELYEQLNIVNESYHGFQHTFILMPELVGNEVSYVVPSKNCEQFGIKPFSTKIIGNKFRDAMLKAADRDQVTYSETYKENGSTWLTAISPIKDRHEQTIAMLSISVEASMIGGFYKELFYYFLIIFLFIVVSVFFVFRWGLNKVLGPVHEMMNGIKEVSHGNFNVKLPVIEGSDLGKFNERFNEMTEQLSILFDQLSLTSNQLGKDSQEFVQKSKFKDALGEMENIIQRTKLLKELQRAEKMNAIGQLAASVAHEIRNPMTVVKGFLQIFSSKKELSSEEHMFVKLMIDELNRAESIINDYLSLAKPDMENTERVDAGELANKVIDLMNSYALMSKNIMVETDINETVFINGNRSELQQVLINILKNGIEAMKDGGTLKLKVYKNDTYGLFEIEDNGIGMSDDEMARLGTAFYSLKEKGTGMGLMVCYQIIERMKGKIEVVSEKGKGTIFTISVPLDDEEDY